MFLDYRDDHEAYDAAYSAETHLLPTVGSKYMVWTIDYVGPNSHLSKGPTIGWCTDNGEGIAGNSDPRSRRYHGWRGTTDDFSVYAYGLRECIKVAVTGDRSKKVRIVFGSDLVLGKD